MHPRHLRAPAYRADIDGLRALAVLAVVGYHAFPDRIHGGFVGVDVFFVISGFLITSILLDGLRQQAFSLRAFYARRIRRIFPALIVVLLACMAIGWFTQVPGDYATLGRHVIGGALFVSNVVLWQESGYFDAVAQFKPLLHLWSLGIEEQFYLLWPPLLLLGRRLGLFRITLVIAMLSLVGSLSLTGRDPSAAFYLPHARIWELLLGGLLAQIASTPGDEPAVLARRWQRQSAALAGLALLAWAVFGFDDDLAFPGWRALVPTVGTALLIAAGPATAVARWLLSLRALVAIGLISYPLYLWHWPLLSFARIDSGGEIGVPLRIALVALSLLLAWGTYVLVERWFRFRLRTRVAVMSLLLMMTATALTGTWLLRAQGFPERAGEPVRRYVDYRYAWQGVSREGTCSLVGDDQPVAFPAMCTDPPDASRRPLVMLWGDSHAAMLYTGLRAVSDARAAMGGRFRIAQFTRSGCRPFLHSGYDLCLRGNAAVLGDVAQARPQVVLLFAHWNHLKFRGGARMLEQLEPTITALRQLRVPRIVIVGPAPRWKGTLPGNLVRLHAERPFLRVPERTAYNLNPDAHALDRMLQDTLGRRKDVTYFSVIDVLCDKRGCLTRIGDDPDVLTTWDYGHLTQPAAAHVAQRLVEMIPDLAGTSRGPVK